LRIALLVTKIDEANDPEKSLAAWRRLAALLKPQTDGWYESKYHVALMLERLGRREEAKKMLLYLKTIPPGWEQSDWKDRFERLLQRCQ
jgi:hypothetical protein